MDVLGRILFRPVRCRHGSFADAPCTASRSPGYCSCHGKASEDSSGDGTEGFQRDVCKPLLHFLLVRCHLRKKKMAETTITPDFVLNLIFYTLNFFAILAYLWQNHQMINAAKQAKGTQITRCSHHLHRELTLFLLANEEQVLRLSCYERMHCLPTGTNTESTIAADVPKC